MVTFSLIAAFVFFSALLMGVVYTLWRYWNEHGRLTPEEEDYERRVASLNERQANRISDEQLRRTIDSNEAWTIMVQRGRRSRRNRRASDTQQRSTPHPRRTPSDK